MYDKEKQNHLERVLKEVKKLVKEHKKDPNKFGHLDSRLYWAIRGMDPHKSICIKHDKKIVKNSYGEYLCTYCFGEFIEDHSKKCDDNIWYDPNDKPNLKTYLKYGLHGFF